MNVNEGSAAHERRAWAEERLNSRTRSGIVPAAAEVPASDQIWAEVTEEAASRLLQTPRLDRLPAAALHPTGAGPLSGVAPATPRFHLPMGHGTPDGRR